jgi:putative ABC transport system permease protein
MNLLENINIAVKTITANKLRSTLTMLGIIIGNASVITMVAVGEGAQQFIQQKLEAFGAHQFYVYARNDDAELFSGKVAQLFLADAEAIAMLAPSVAEVAPIIGGNLQLSHKERTLKADVIGTTKGILFLQNLNVERGRFFDLIEQQQSSQVVILGPVIAEKLFGRENPLGESVQINKLSFQVIGVMKSKGSFFNLNPDETVYVPITTMSDRLVGGRSPLGIPIDRLELSAIKSVNLKAAAFQTINILTRRHGRKDFSVATSKSFQDFVNQVSGTLSLTLAAIASISLLVGGIGIMNIMLVSVTERTQEIGLRKAIGATEGAILTQFLIEAIILSVAGGLIGTSIGISGTVMVSIFTPLHPSVPLEAVLLSVGVSSSIGVIFGVAPARRAARLDPIVALRGA